MARPIIDPVAKHRRDVWLRMVLPIIGVALVVTLIVVGLFTLAVMGTYSPQQIETMASVLMIICVLTPLVVGMLGLNAIIVVIAVGTGKLPAMLRPGLRRIRQQIIHFTDAVPKVARRISRPFVAFDARWTRWENFLLKLIGMDAKPAAPNEGQKTDE